MLRNEDKIELGNKAANWYNYRTEDCDRDQPRNRIVVEHAFARLKKYRIINDVFRNKIRRYDRVPDIVSGQVNYNRIMNISC